MKTLYSYPELNLITVDWGDGSPLQYGASSLSLTHEYTEPGTYPVQVTVQNTLGFSTTKVVLFKLGAINENLVRTDWMIEGEAYSTPEVQHRFLNSGKKLITCEIENELGQVKTLHALQPIGGGAYPSEADWTFDDGSPNGSGLTNYHTYMEGTYNPDVEVTWSDGAVTNHDVDEITVNPKSIAIQDLLFSDSMLIMGAHYSKRGIRLDNQSKDTINL